MENSRHFTEAIKSTETRIPEHSYLTAWTSAIVIEQNSSPQDKLGTHKIGLAC